ncbi:MAG: TIGR02611 family protein [Sciscionella sp.]
MAENKTRRDAPARQGAGRQDAGEQGNNLSARMGRIVSHYRAFRERIGRRRGLDLAFRIGVGLIGVVVLVGGILLIPYPGPGWLVVFAGLAILATEFEWAGRLLRYTRSRYDAWNAWLRRQNVWVRLGVLGGIGLLVLTMLWLLGVLTLVGGWFGMHWSWLRSPLGLFS